MEAEKASKAGKVAELFVNTRYVRVRPCWAPSAVCCFSCSSTHVESTLRLNARPSAAVCAVKSIRKHLPKHLVEQQTLSYHLLRVMRQYGRLARSAASGRQAGCSLLPAGSVATRMKCMYPSCVPPFLQVLPSCPACFSIVSLQGLLRWPQQGAQAVVHLLASGSHHPHHLHRLDAHPAGAHAGQLL